MNDWIVDLIEQGGYLGILFLAALENIFPPIPSELIMGLGGIDAGQGQFNLWLVILAGTVGTVIGNYFWYWLGWRFDRDQLDDFIRKHGRWFTLDRGDVAKLDRLFTHYGFGIIFVARFVPGIRTMISLPAGLFDMPHWKFFVATFAGSFIWNAAWASGGYFLGARVKEIDSYLGPLTWVVIGALLAVYLWRVLTWTPSGQQE
jgi:membrane protein DedA with SNARE-associated domain